MHDPEKPAELENLKSLFTFTETRGYEWETGLNVIYNQTYQFLSIKSAFQTKKVHDDSSSNGARVWTDYRQCDDDFALSKSKVCIYF